LKALLGRYQWLFGFGLALAYSRSRHVCTFLAGVAALFTAHQASIEATLWPLQLAQIQGGAAPA
jgi:hypothetical protein